MSEERSEERFDVDAYMTFLEIWEIESDEREYENLKMLCLFYERYNDYPLYDLLEEELSAYPLEDLCWDFEVMEDE